MRRFNTCENPDAERRKREGRCTNCTRINPTPMTLCPICLEKARENTRRSHAWLDAHHLCRSCKRALPAGYTQTLCEECKERIYLARKKRRCIVR